MEIIADTSAIIAVILNEPERNEIIRMTTGYKKIIAPESVFWEVGNAFSAMLKRKRLHIDSVIKAVAMFKRMPVRFTEVSLEASLKISDEQNIYAYDAYLIECAIRHKKPFITLDNKLARIAGLYQIEVLEVKR
jgi:predicted nucleic acid-binding protein